MALTVPDADELATFMHETFSSEEEEWAEAELQRAADLMAIAINTETNPSDSLGLRLMKDGILDMAAYLFVRSENRSETYTPFQSERIGSYSYSKMMGQASTGQPTGVELFDAAVMYLVGLSETEGDGVVRYDGECVFERKDDGPYLKDIDDYQTTVLPDFYGW